MNPCELHGTVLSGTRFGRGAVSASLCTPFNAEHLEAVLEMAPAVVSFHFGCRVSRCSVPCVTAVSLP
ncbi:MAG: hypothetical protein CM1200mP41_05000 [Gammaproteobacteria bacterium]|nr:MAG: hypothetical protein CM1200mP41_05000 [Gammaproteobacteria bacterium]